MCRRTNAEPPIFPHDPNVIAVATDQRLDTVLPQLELDDATKIAEFIAARLELGSS